LGKNKWHARGKYYIRCVPEHRSNNYLLSTPRFISELLSNNKTQILPATLFINPLMPELNPSAQCCLTRFFTGDFASLNRAFH
jgi:hypothetical protein